MITLTTFLEKKTYSLILQSKQFLFLDFLDYLFLLFRPFHVLHMIILPGINDHRIMCMCMYVVICVFWLNQSHYYLVKCLFYEE